MSYIDELYSKNAYNMAVNTLHQANETDVKAEQNASSLELTNLGIDELAIIIDAQNTAINDLAEALAEKEG